MGSSRYWCHHIWLGTYICRVLAKINRLCSHCYYYPLSKYTPFNVCLTNNHKSTKLQWPRFSLRHMNNRDHWKVKMAGYAVDSKLKVHRLPVELELIKSFPSLLWRRQSCYGRLPMPHRWSLGAKWYARTSLFSLIYGKLHLLKVLVCEIFGFTVIFFIFHVPYAFRF